MAQPVIPILHFSHCMLLPVGTEIIFHHFDTILRALRLLTRYTCDIQIRNHTIHVDLQISVSLFLFRIKGEDHLNIACGEGFSLTGIKQTARCTICRLVRVCIIVQQIVLYIEMNLRLRCRFVPAARRIPGASSIAAVCSAAAVEGCCIPGILRCLCHIILVIPVHPEAIAGIAKIRTIRGIAVFFVGPQIGCLCRFSCYRAAV